MAERICLMTFCPTDCKDDCFNCDCGGAEATKDMYVSINNVQRVCSITGGAADTDEGEYIAEVIRNNLENMVIPAEDVYPVKHGRWIISNLYAQCSECSVAYDLDTFQRLIPMNENVPRHCAYCGARMKED